MTSAPQIDAGSAPRSAGGLFVRVLILIFFGGMDSGDHTGRAVEAMASLGLHGVHVDVVVGRRHPRVDELSVECSRAGFSYHVQTERMAELLGDEIWRV